MILARHKTIILVMLGSLSLGILSHGQGLCGEEQKSPPSDEDALKAFARTYPGHRIPRQMWEKHHQALTKEIEERSPKMQLAPGTYLTEADFKAVPSVSSGGPASLFNGRPDNGFIGLDYTIQLRWETPMNLDLQVYEPSGNYREIELVDKGPAVESFRTWTTRDLVEDDKMYYVAVLIPDTENFTKTKAVITISAAEIPSLRYETMMSGESGKECWIACSVNCQTGEIKELGVFDSSLSGYVDALAEQKSSQPEEVQ